MAFTPRHGRKAFMSVTTSTGGTVTLSSGFDDTGMARTVDTAEITTHGSTDKKYLAGLRDATISLGGIYTSTQAKTLEGLLGHSTNTSFIYGPEGNTTGFRKYSGKAIITALNYGSPVSDKVVMSVSAQVTAGVTAGTF